MIKYGKFSITNSGYRGHVEALAWLGIPPEKAALEIKARAPPGGGPALPLGRTTQLTEEKLSEARTLQRGSHARTPRRETQQPLQSLTFGKHSEPLKGLSITTCGVGNGTDFPELRVHVFKLQHLTKHLPMAKGRHAY